MIKKFEEFITEKNAADELADIKKIAEILKDSEDISDVEIFDRPNWGKCVKFKWAQYPKMLFTDGFHYEEKNEIDVWVYTKDYSTRHFDESIPLAHGFKTAPKRNHEFND